MKLRPIELTCFTPSNKELKNPYRGFMSFNHFRGEKLFSNSVAGIYKERYPLQDDVEQNGREEGWHPDTELAYIRTCWKDFEPKQGQYNFKMFEEIFELAKEHKQHLIIRLMPHTTRESEDVPDWLKELIPCPERPDAKRIKESPSDPLFLQLFTKAIKAFAEKFDTSPILYAVDVSLFGAWGEGHGYETASKEEIDNLMNVFAGCFKNTHVFGQVCGPELIEKVNKTYEKPIGLRADGFGSPSQIQWHYPRLTKDIKDLWKVAPITIEAWWYMNEWDRHNFGDIDYLIDKALDLHLSSFNNKSSTIPFKWYGNVQRLINRMGYRFFISSFFFPDKASKGDELDCKMVIENLGVAPIYTKHPFTIRLKSENFEKIYNTDIDITSWLPGDKIEQLPILLPSDIENGKYKIQVGLVGEYPTPTIYFANDIECEDGYYTVAQIEIE